jgi:sulfatase modifying factor 1
MNNSIKRTIQFLTASLILMIFQGCSQFETPLEIPETGTIQVITTSDAKCTLYLSDKPIMDWTGSKIISGLMSGNYIVKITSDKFNSTFEEAIKLGKTEHKKLESGIGSLDIKIKSDFSWELSKEGKVLFTGKGSYKIDTLWSGNYKVKVTIPGATINYSKDLSIIKSQINTLEMEYGTVDVRVLNSMEVTLFNGTTETTRWYGTKTVDSLWVGDYTVKIKVNPALPEYETSFKLAKQQTKVVELEYGTLEVRVQDQMECVLVRGTTEIERWFGSRKYDSLWVGDYTVKIKVNPALPDYETSFTLAKQQTKVVELEYGTLDVKVQNQMECVLLRGTTELDRWTGTRKIDSLLVGDYTVKIKVNPLLPDYETSFPLANQQTKIIEPLLGSFVIKTKSDYQNTLLLEGVEIVSWTGTKEFNPFIAGSYILKSKMFPSSSAIEQSFIIQQIENKIIEWEYGKITVNTLPASTCKLKRGGNEILSWQGSITLDSIIVGNYTLEIQEAVNHPVWIENFILQKDEQKIIAVPYASIEVTSNVSISLTKLIFNGNTIKTLTGSGMISSIVPGNYTFTVEASGYTSQTENITLSIGQILPKNVQLIQIPTFTPMIYIPSGTFTMGCTFEQTNCGFDELPTHQVSLSAYEIGKYEVTQKEWRTVMGTSPSYFTGDYMPVESVSWNDIITFCNTLSSSEGLTPVYTVNGSTVTANWSANGYRLPTEAEWEYAARGGASSTNTLYSGSNTLEDVGWSMDNSDSTTHDVGTRSPNQLGIYDMSGNIYEWCWDWYSSSYYTSASQTNPKGPNSGYYRVLRGGSWNVLALHCRVALRSEYEPDNRFYAFGFRLVRTK